MRRSTLRLLRGDYVYIPVIGRDNIRIAAPMLAAYGAPWWVKVEQDERGVWREVAKGVHGVKANG